MPAFYSNKITNFLTDDPETIIGSLAAKSDLAGFHQLLHSQTRSWRVEIDILKSQLASALQSKPEIGDFGILLEYPIPRRAKRIDVVIIAHDIIIVIEFKVGQSTYLNSDRDQVLDYCLDIRDFHFESRGRVIIPVLLATNAKALSYLQGDNLDLVKELRFANSNDFGKLLVGLSNEYATSGDSISMDNWDNSHYSPTPTIIEAAQTLYAGKSVVEISQSHAGKINLKQTSEAVIEAIKQAQANNEKIICFITGVPGAGKTLAGLNIAHDKAFQDHEKSLATFLSGNGPLIKVLREALSRDAHSKVKKLEPSAKKKASERIVSFIENVHRFIDHYFLDKERVPNNKIVIFDEAQRAWNAEHSMRKFQRNFSEAEMMFDVMSRHTDWAVIVALVGGGQEINTGEAGLPEWGRVLEQKYPDWKVYISPQLKIGDHSTGNLTLFTEMPQNVNIIENKYLHLEVSVRSYKAEKLSYWVNLVLANDAPTAKQVYDADLNNFNIYITQDLEKARKWLRTKCKGSRRMGLVASSGGRRLRPYGLDVRTPLEEAEWFLNGRDDVRSSYYLEIPATEFGVQGLELDWVGVCWDADLRRNCEVWDVNAFRGTKWQRVSNEDMRRYVLNKYRVLLTRAREGMIIFVPRGNENDPTRMPDVYEEIAQYIKSCGVVEL